jgi:hypothetical protein
MKDCLIGRLTFVGLDRARQAPEPVFSIAEELAFQNFHSVFRTGFDDPALLNAVMFSLAFAVTGGSIDQECLRYQSQAISYIRERVGSLGEATSESTIGAILLLAGVEVYIHFIFDELRPLIQLSTYLGSAWNYISGSTSYGGSAAAAQDVSNKGCLSHWRDQTGHLLVSTVQHVLIVSFLHYQQARPELLNPSRILSHI